MVVPGRTCAGPGGLADGHQPLSRSASRGRSTRIIRGQEFDDVEPVLLISPVRLEIVFVGGANSPMSQLRLLSMKPSWKENWRLPSAWRGLFTTVLRAEV
jgi:hypothetical protein